MSATVQDLMENFSSLPFLGDNEGEPTMSKKVWTEIFPALDPLYTTTWPPTTQSIERFLGPAYDTPSSADFLGLQTTANHLNTLLQVVATEGDVTRDFDQNIIPSVALAFSGGSAMTFSASGPQPGAPKLWSRSLSGPVGYTSCTKTIDYQMTMEHPEEHLGLAAMVGEMKRPGMIKPDEWRQKKEPSPKTRNLERELRGYASEYRCPQIFVFDTANLVIVQFKASSAEDIAKGTCPVDICVIPRENDGSDPHQCTMQYALYRLAWRGWVRLCATLESESSGPRNFVRAEKPLSRDGYTRRYEYWSGRPVWWLDLDAPNHWQKYPQHPNKYWRDFTYKYFQREDGTMGTQGFWVWKNGEPGWAQETIEVDTGNCFT